MNNNLRKEKIYMECPYCGAELIQIDVYGTGRHEYYYGTAANGIHYPSTWKQLGEIYKCPNREGFDDLDEAKSYQETEEDPTDLELEDVVCCSNAFNGYFYTDEQCNLMEGYPC